MERALNLKVRRAVAVVVMAAGWVIIDWYLKRKRRRILSRRNRLMMRSNYVSRHIYQSVNDSIPSPSSYSTRRGQKRKRQKRDREAQILSEIQLVAQKIGEVALALNTDFEMKFARSLYKEVMSMEGYSDTVKCTVYDYLLENGMIGRGFIVKRTEHRQIWMDGFLKRSAREF